MERNNRKLGAGNTENKDDTESTLNYIDKVYDMFCRANSVVTRAGLILQIVSLLMFIISAGWIAPKEDFVLGGLGLEIPLSVLLGGGIVLITIFYITFYSAWMRALVLQSELVELYKSIGYDEWADRMLDDMTGFPASDLMTTVLAPSQSSLVSPKYQFTKFVEALLTLFLAFSLALIVPMVAACMTLYRFASTIGWDKLLIWAPFSIFIIVILVLPILFFVEQERGESR